MNGRWGILLLLAAVTAGGLVFVNPALARRCDTGLIAYDGWITEDYRYQIPYVDSEDVRSGGIADPDIYAGVSDVTDFSDDSNFDPVGAIFGVFNWISESVGSVFGAEVGDPYDADP